jgi:hypothetical protein
MEHARVNLMTADPANVEDIVKYIENDARLHVEDELENRGRASS